MTPDEILKGACGFSCDGALVTGDEASVKKVRQWCSEAATIPEFRRTILIERTRAETAERERDEARSKLAEYETALNQIACWDDKSASESLERTRSYSSFDEPGSVQIAREAIAAAIRNRSGQ